MRPFTRTKDKTFRPPLYRKSFPLISFSHHSHKCDISALLSNTLRPEKGYFKVKQQRCHAHYLAELGLNLLMDGLVALLHLLLVFDHHGEPVQRARVELLSVGLHDLTQVLSLLHHVSPRLKSSKGDREVRDEGESERERWRGRKRDRMGKQ